jgi:hypothetical protein
VCDRVPLAPDTVTVYNPAGVDGVVEIVIVLVPEEPGVRLMLVGLKVKVMPAAAGETVADSATLPVKPRLFEDIVEVALPPAVKLAGVAGPEVNVKSPTTITVSVAVWDSVPLAPVTVTVYVPAGVDAVVAIVSVAVPEDPGVRLMLVGLKVNVTPVAVGLTVADNPTLPVKPRLLAEIVDVALPPAVKLGLDGALAAIA